VTGRDRGRRGGMEGGREGGKMPFFGLDPSGQPKIEQ